jgi:hypothetical protein
MLLVEARRTKAKERATEKEWAKDGATGRGADSEVAGCGVNGLAWPAALYGNLSCGASTLA